MENLIFICGHRKCGTTMFSDLFNGHPKLSVFPTDLSIFYGYYPVYTDGKFSIEEQLERLENVIFLNLKRVFKKEILNLEDIVNQALMKEYFYEKIDKTRLSEINHILEIMLKAFHVSINHDINDYDWLVLKETSLEIYAIELNKFYPNAKFLHLIRDPRDNYASLKSGSDKHYKLFGEDEKHSLFSMINRYHLGFKIIKSNIDVIGKENYKVVKYEDLCNNTESVMANISTFLGIEYSDILLTPTILGKETKGNNYEGENFNTVNAFNVDRWKERINDDEAKIIEFHFQEFMNQFHYKTNFSLKEQSIAATEFYKWLNYKYLFKDSFKVLNK